MGFRMLGKPLGLALHPIDGMGTHPKKEGQALRPAPLFLMRVAYVVHSISGGKNAYQGDDEANTQVGLHHGNRCVAASDSSVTTAPR